MFLFWQILCRLFSLQVASGRRWTQFFRSECRSDILFVNLFQLRSPLHIHPSTHPFFLPAYLGLQLPLGLSHFRANLPVCLWNKSWQTYKQFYINANIYTHRLDRDCLGILKTAWVAWTELLCHPSIDHSQFGLSMSLFWRRKVVAVAVVVGVAVVASCTINQLDSGRTGMSNAKTVMCRNV